MVKRISGDRFLFDLLSYESWVNIRERKARQKKTNKKKWILLSNMLEQTFGVRWVKSVLTLLWRRSLSNRNQTFDFWSKSVDWFLYDRDLHHERVNALLLACIHRDILIDYNKIIDIYASKYLGRMFLINPLVKTKLLKKLYFIVLICIIKIFLLLQLGTTKNYELIFWLTLIKRHICTFCQ